MAMNYLMLKYKLEGEYGEAFDKVLLYTEVRNMDGSVEEEMMMNLLDMLLSAQNENKPVEKIIGKDIEQFCESYFEEYNIKTRVKDQIPKRIYSFMWFVFIFEMLDLFFCISEENLSVFKATTDITGYMVGLMCGVLLAGAGAIFVKPFIFRWKKMNATLYSTIVFIVMAILIVGSCVFIEDKEIYIPIFPLLVVSGLYIVIYYIARAVLRYKEHGSIWKDKKIFQDSWFRSVGESVELQLPGELVKNYYKINKKRVRRGKEEMTPEEFMEKLRKDNKTSEKANMIAAILLTVFLAALVIHSAVTESILDAAILTVILCAIEAPIYYTFFWIGTKSRSRVLEKCDEKGITIIEYVNGEQK